MITALSRSELEVAQKDKRHLEGLKCPACHEEKGRVLRLGIRNQPDTPVFVCDHCRLQFIEPHWTTEAALRDYWSALRFEQALTLDEHHERQRLYALESIKNFTEKIPEGGSVLEIGC